MPILELLFTTKLAPSKKEARRLIEQGGVSINNEKVSDFMAKIDLSEQKLIKVGKRKFLNVIYK